MIWKVACYMISKIECSWILKHIYSFGKQNSGCQSVGMKGKEGECEYKVVAQGVFLMVMEQFYILIVVVVSQICTADKIS